MKTISLKANKQTMIICAVAVAVLLIAVGASYYLLSKELSAAGKQLQAKQRMVEDSKKIATRLTDVEQQLLDAKMELANLETSVTTYEYVPTLLSQLETLGLSNSLRVVSVRPQPKAAPPPVKKPSENADDTGGASAEQAEKPKPYEELKIDIETEGSYFEVRNFMFHLTQFPKIVGVNSLQIAPSGVSRGFKSPTLQARFNITAYIFPDLTPVATPEKAEPVGTPASASRIDRRPSDAG